MKLPLSCQIKAFCLAERRKSKRNDYVKKKKRNYSGTNQSMVYYISLQLMDYLVKEGISSIKCASFPFSQLLE
jgi:hypothetical protein